MPNLSAKELAAIEASLTSEEHLVKKFEAMAVMCQDPKIRGDLQSVAQKHQQHANSLAAFLQ